MLKGAIFDMDGTLFDTEKIYWNCWLETADFFGLPRQPELPGSMSGSGWESMPAKLKKFYPDFEDVNAYIMHVVTTARSKIEANLEIKAGAFEILNYFFDNGVKIAIASSSEVAAIEKNIQRVGWEKFFTAFVGGNQVKESKPNPEIFLKAADALNLSPTDCYVFEDSFNGVRAGNSAKCSTVMVIDCKQPTDEIRKLCTGVYDDMFGALEAVKRGEI